MKKVIGFYILFQVMLKTVSFFVSLNSDESSLPIFPFLVCAFIVATAIYELVQIFTKKARLKTMTQFFVLTITLTIVNIVYMHFQSVEMIWADAWVTGNLFDILVDSVILIYLGREKKYIRSKYTVREDSEKEKPFEEIAPVAKKS